MKSSFGNSVSVTISGESHGGALVAVLSGLAPGIPVDEGFIAAQLTKRRPAGIISTARREDDKFEILSGVFGGFTTGTPITILIPNENTVSRDYSEIACCARPGHADYAAQCKYHGYQDYRGGGHFSGRVTAALVAAGAIALSALNRRGIKIGTHIASCGGVKDRAFGNFDEDIDLLNSENFAVLDAEAGKKMEKAILSAKESLDSVGGVLETAVIGVPAGVGEPFFDSVESCLSHILFSIPAIKGVEFGSGFAMADMRASEANDPFGIDENGRIQTKTNHNGGINGGITNGAPIIFRCAVKPTPSVARPQQTVDFVKEEEKILEIHGRHDPAIVHRARVVADSAAAIALCDLLAQRYGTDWLGG